VPTIRVRSPRESSGPASSPASLRAMQIGSSVGTAVLNTVAVDAARDFVGAPTEALVVGAALVVAFLRPAAPAHHHNSEGL
jgi:hypothetical protein